MSDIPQVYVGTYAKYNSGNLNGEWLQLEDYASRDEFYEACAKLHSDEPDPEFMFQAYEGFPKAFYSESHLADELWDWLDLDESDRELLAVYIDWTNDDAATIRQARDAFMGTFKDEEDWAYDYIDGTGMLSAMPENLRNYFDYAAFARDAHLGGDVAFIEHAGETWVFDNH